MTEVAFVDVESLRLPGLPLASHPLWYISGALTANFKHIGFSTSFQFRLLCVSTEPRSQKTTNWPTHCEEDKALWENGIANCHGQDISTKFVLKTFLGREYLLTIFISCPVNTSSLSVWAEVTFGRLLVNWTLDLIFLRFISWPQSFTVSNC